MRTPRWELLRRGWVVAALGLALLAAIAGRAAFSAPDVPTTAVREGEFQEVLTLRGEVRPVRSITLTAPARGFDFRIVRLARPGSIVKAGQPVIEFDRSLVMNSLHEKNSELKAATAQIDQIRARRQLAEQQLETDLQKARYDVERARLDLRAEEFLSRVDVEQRRLALADAESALQALEEKIRSERAAAAAELTSARQKRDKARYEVDEARQQIERLTVLAPADGMVTLLPNWRAGGGPGGAPEFREGDRTWGGAPIAELPDLSRLRIAARLDEIERTRLAVGLPATVRIDAVADREFTGTLVAVSAMTRPDFTTFPPARMFEAVVELEGQDPRIRPGMNASVRLVVDRVPRATLVPVHALFDEGGRTIVYVRVRGGFEPRPVAVARRGVDDAMVAAGVKPGDVLALERPDAEDSR